MNQKTNMIYRFSAKGSLDIPLGNMIKSLAYAAQHSGVDVKVLNKSKFIYEDLITDLPEDSKLGKVIVEDYYSDSNEHMNFNVFKACSPIFPKWEMYSSSLQRSLAQRLVSIASSDKVIIAVDSNMSEEELYSGVEFEEAYADIIIANKLQIPYIVIYSEDCIAKVKNEILLLDQWKNSFS